MLPGSSLEYGSRSVWVEILDMAGGKPMVWEMGREYPGQSLKLICGIGREGHSRPRHYMWAPG